MKDWREAEHSLEDTEVEIRRLKDLGEAVLEASESAVSFRMVRVDCAETQTELSEKALRMADAIQRFICSQWVLTNRAVVDRCVRPCLPLCSLLQQPFSCKCLAPASP